MLDISACVPVPPSAFAGAHCMVSISTYVRSMYVCMVTYESRQGRFITIIEVIHKIVQYITIKDLLLKISYVELFMMMTIYVFIGRQTISHGREEGRQCEKNATMSGI